MKVMLMFFTMITILVVMPLTYGQTYLVSGVVVDSGGPGYFETPNDGWPVYLKQGGQYIDSTYTLDYQYTFSGLENGEYIVAAVRVIRIFDDDNEVERIRYVRDSIVVTVNGGDLIDQNIAFHGYPEVTGNNINTISDFRALLAYFRGHINTFDSSLQLYGDYLADHTLVGSDLIYLNDILNRTHPPFYIFNDPHIVEQAIWLSDPAEPDSIFIMHNIPCPYQGLEGCIDIYFSGDDSLHSFLVPIVLPEAFTYDEHRPISFYNIPEGWSKPIWIYQDYPNPENTSITIGGFSGAYHITLNLPLDLPLHIASIPIIISDEAENDTYYKVEIGIDSIQACSQFFGIKYGAGEFIPAVSIDSVLVGHTCSYIPGDINDNGYLSGNDVTYGIQYLKGIGNPPPEICFNDSTQSCLFAAADANGNCRISGSDITYLVSYFKGIHGSILWCPWTPPE